jgi:hypothetical protein
MFTRELYERGWQPCSKIYSVVKEEGEGRRGSDAPGDAVFPSAIRSSPDISFSSY